MELVRRYPDDLEAYRCFWAVARRTGVWDEAVAALQGLRAADPGDPRPLLYLAAIRVDQGDPEGRVLYQQAATEFAALGESYGEVYSRMGLAFWLGERGRHEEAGPQLERALEVAARTEDEALVARVRLALGWRAATGADYATARSEFEAVEARVDAETPFDIRQGVLNGLGYVAWSTGRFRDALGYYRREAEVCSDAGDVHAEAGARYNAAFMAEALAERPEDRSAYDELWAESLDASIRAADRDLEARLRMMVAQPFDGDPDRMEHAERALELGYEMESEDRILEAMRGVAIHRFAAGDHEGGLSTAQQCLARARERGFGYAEIATGVALANLLWEDGDREASVEMSMQTLRAVESLRDKQTADEEQARVASRYAFAFYQLFGRLVTPCAERGECSDLGPALQVMERLRAHGLVETFEAAGAADAASGVDTDGLTFSLASIKELLGEDEAILSYQITNTLDAGGRWQGGSWVVVMTRAGFRVRPLPDAAQINPAVDLLLGLIETRAGAPLTEAASRLSEWVLEPALVGLPDSIRRLVVVPDGSLHGLPFALLPSRSGEKPLVLSHAVSTVPSLAVWAHWRRSPAAIRDARILGVADPEIAIGVESSASERGEDRSRQPLAHARSEVRQLSRRAGGGSTVLAGSDANRLKLGDLALGQYSVLHFATHAEVDASDPGRSAVLLAPGEHDDGRFGIADIVDLELKDPLVVLASCRSATGVALQGEGVLGLTRGFLHAGARAVIGGLWPVEDRATARLIDRFYQHLAGGETVAAALAAAQRELISDDIPPADWAGLVIVGDGELKVDGLQGRGGVMAPIFVVAACVVVVLIGLWRHRRRKQ